MSALSLLIIHREYKAEWAVWISLSGFDGFGIGRGETRDQAVADAVQALEAAVEQLQGPRGGIEERAVQL